MPKGMNKGQKEEGPMGAPLSWPDLHILIPKPAILKIREEKQFYLRSGCIC
jgi:hypothetical protein